MSKIKQSLATLQKMTNQTQTTKTPSSLAEKGKRGKAAREKGTAATAVDPLLQAELAKLNTLVQNLDLMQSEAANSYELLVTQTEGLNQAILSKFEQFRSRPIRTKHFTVEEKSQLRQALTHFELSDDEEQVDLEEIQLGDGKYEKISGFALNVRKLKKLINAQ